MKAGLLVFLLAAIARAFVLGLDFRLDDVVQIPMAGAKLRDELSALGLGEKQAEVNDDARFRFRPVLWLSFLLDARISGSPLNPLVFQGTSIALHALAATLLLVVSRRWMRPRAAILTAAIFAIHPAGAQATSWIAARGDLLATVALLASLAVLIRTPGARRVGALFLAGLFAATALASKDTALPGVVILGVVLLQKGGRVGVRLTSFTIFVAPVLALWTWRSLAVGTWLPAHPSGGAAGKERLLTAAGDLPSLLTHVLVPWQRSERFAAEDPVIATLFGSAAESVRGGCAAVLGLMVLYHSVRKRRLADLGLTLAAASALALPPLMIFVKGSGALIDRTLPVLAATLALGMGRVLVGPRNDSSQAQLSRGTRKLAFAAGLLFFALTADSLVHVARTERAAAAVQRSEIAMVKEAHEGNRVVLVAGAPLVIGHAPALGDQYPYRFRAPFEVPAIKVVHTYDLSELQKSGWFREVPSGISVLMMDQTGILRQGPRLPPLPNKEMVRLDLQDPKDAFPYPARALGALRVPLRGPRMIDFQAEVSTTSKTYRFAARGSAPFAIVDTSSESGLLLEDFIQSIRFDIEAGSIEGPVELLRDVPGLTQSAPLPGAEIPLGEAIEFAFGGDSELQSLRLELQIRLPAHAPFELTYEAKVAPPLPPQGVITYRAKPEDRVHALPPGLHWDDLAPLFRKFGVEAGMRRLTLLWRVSELSAAGAVLRRSGWSEVHLIPR